ncbi:hypothetical protein D5086_009936 [Populus alba]|uniref:Uncharacterized protein n=1 Tax=Populus alba TaxID=43335 RepID=A0ACC4C8K9_POPAL
MFLFQFKVFQLVLLLALSEFCFQSANCREISNRNLFEASCPLNYSVFRELVSKARPKYSFIDLPNQCQFVPDGIRFVRSEYLRTARSFVPPPDTFQACWQSYRNVIREVTDGLDIQSGCGYQAGWISKGCLNITSVAQFEIKFPESKLQEMKLYCNRSLDDDLACGSCTKRLLSLGDLYLRDPQPVNTSDCSGYLSMYAAAIINRFGPTDPGTAKCLFRLKYSVKSTTDEHHKAAIAGIAAGSVFGVLGGFIAVCLRWKLHGKSDKEKISPDLEDASLDLGFGLHIRSTNIVKFKIEEITKATMNFSRHNIIGKGGYGNVFKGMLPDGSEVAFKRFKNCSGSGDATFAHEVEIIASVRHVNLVALRGYCTTKVPQEAHQRIIVCDLMHNGSLYNHLFESGKMKLSWPTHWAWSLAKEGRGLDIIEDNLPELGLPEVMEQHVHVALICAHPLLHARPTMDQIVNMLESSNMPVPSIPEPCIAASNMEICSISSSYNFSSSVTQ